MNLKQFALKNIVISFPKLYNTWGLTFEEEKNYPTLHPSQKKGVGIFD
jgi:hypothetical protein